MSIQNYLENPTSRRAFLGAGAAVFAAEMFSPVLVAGATSEKVSPIRITGRKFHVSSKGNDSSSGLTPQAAWQTLEHANQGSFEAGDAILLRCGDVFHGQLRPQGCGAHNRPIVIGSYGSGRHPILDIGAAPGAAVKLEDQSWWEIRELEITSGAPTDPAVGRQGIVALAKTEGKLHDIAIHDCFIHDIWGTLYGHGALDQYNSSAIFVGGRQGSPTQRTPSENLLVEGNRIERVDRCGIIACGCNKGLVIRHNRIDNLGGDAIVPINCDFVLVERNFVTRSCLRTGDAATWMPEFAKARRGNPHSAAIWLFGSKGGIMQFNEVYDTGRAAGNGDGEGYDIDLGCSNCVLQYNYSRNNHGMLLIMQRTSGNIARYNISENDQTHLLALRPNLSDTSLIHNNVFYIDYGIAEIEMRDDERERKDTTKVGVPLRNNIFYATGEGRFKVTYLDPTVPDPTPGPNRLFLNNCYFGPWLGDGPNDSDRATNTYDPLFVAPGCGGMGLDSLKGYQLRPDSPCIGRGVPISANGGRDFWGNPLPDDKIDIGAYQHRAV